MSRISSLQDPFLNALRKEKISVSIYLVNGIKLQGQIEAFDQFAIVLRNTVNQMVYKHAVSTIVPSRAVRLVYSNYNPNHQQGQQASHDDSEDQVGEDFGLQEASEEVSDSQQMIDEQTHHS